MEDLNLKTWLKKKYELFFTHEHWNIGYVEQTKENLMLTKTLNNKISWLKEGVPEYAADPFPIKIENKFLIYYEEMTFWNGKGKLMMIDSPDFKSKKAVTGIENGRIHLSYPFLFEENGKCYCLPETSAIKEVALYEVDKKQPEKLTKLWTILSGEKYVDSSLIYYQDKYWLFTTHSGKPDQLYIYHSTQLTEKFRPHSLNPIHMDKGIGRSAGKPFIVDDKLYLPCQNPAKCYGGSVVIHELTKLNPTSFSYKQAFEILPRAPYNKGLHTINFHQEQIIIDGKRTVFSPIAALKKLSKKLRE